MPGEFSHQLHPMSGKFSTTAPLRSPRKQFARPAYAKLCSKVPKYEKNYTQPCSQDRGWTRLEIFSPFQWTFLSWLLNNVFHKHDVYLQPCHSHSDSRSPAPSSSPSSQLFCKNTLWRHWFGLILCLNFIQEQHEAVQLGVMFGKPRSWNVNTCRCLYR